MYSRLTLGVYLAFEPDAGGARKATNARPIYEAVRSKDQQFYVPKTGVYGSKTLQTDVDPAGASRNWREVLAFLKENFG